MSSSDGLFSPPKELRLLITVNEFLIELIKNEGTAVLMATHNFTLVEDRGYQFMQIKEGEVTL